MIIRKNILLQIEEEDIADGTCIIPSGTVCIHDAAFRDCLELKRLIIPQGVTHIGNLAFWGCKNLKAIRFPKGLSSIGNAAFRGCEALETLTFPKGIKNIGKAAFSGCTNLRTVIFKERGTRIKHNAFNGCLSLAQVQNGATSYRIKCIDGICMNMLSEKKKGSYTVCKCQDFPAQSQTLWAAEKDGISASGPSLTGAIRNLDFKLLKDLPVNEHISRIRFQGFVPPLDYSLITGMGIRSADRFLNQRHMSWNAKWTLAEAISFTKGGYGHETFVKALEEYGCIP